MEGTALGRGALGSGVDGGKQSHDKPACRRLECRACWMTTIHAGDLPKFEKGREVCLDLRPGCTSTSCRLFLCPPTTSSRLCLDRLCS